MIPNGTVVKVIAGKEKGRFMAVCGFKSDMVLLCDGKRRSKVNAKAKNLKHIESTDIVLTECQMAANRELRRALRNIAADA